MTLDPRLEPEAETRLSAFGGLEPARRHFTDKQIEEIVLFYGFTLTLTPFSTVQTIVLITEDGEVPTDFMLPVPFVNFTDLGYIPDSEICVLDTSFNVVFKTVLQGLKINGIKQALWGLTEPQRQFIQNARTGDRFYALLQTTKSTQLIQLLICKERHPLDKAEDIAQINQGLKQLVPPEQHELIFTLPANSEFYILEAPPYPELSTYDIIRDERSLVFTDFVVFISPRSDTWFTAIERKESTVEVIAYKQALLGYELKEAIRELKQMGFKQKTTFLEESEGSVVLTRNQEYTENITLVVSPDTGLVTELKAEAYQIFTLINQVGQELWRIKSRGDAWTIIVGKTETSLLIKGRRAGLTTRFLQSKTSAGKTKATLTFALPGEVVTEVPTPTPTPDPGVCPGPGYEYPYDPEAGEFSTEAPPAWGVLINSDPVSGQPFNVGLDLTNSSRFEGALYWSLRPSEFFLAPEYPVYTPDIIQGPTAGVLCLDLEGPAFGFQQLEITIAENVLTENIPVEFVLSSGPNGTGTYVNGWVFFVNFVPEP